MRVRGIWMPAANSTETNITVVAEPAAAVFGDSDSRAVLPEGSRRMSQLRFYIATPAGTTSVMPIRDGTAAGGPDIIRYKTQEYRVSRVGDYAIDGHLEVVATRPEGNDA